MVHEIQYITWYWDIFTYDTVSVCFMFMLYIYIYGGDIRRWTSCVRTFWHFRLLSADRDVIFFSLCVAECLCLDGHIHICCALWMAEACACTSVSGRTKGKLETKLHTRKSSNMRTISIDGIECRLFIYRMSVCNIPNVETCDPIYSIRCVVFVVCAVGYCEDVNKQLRMEMKYS